MKKILALVLAGVLAIGTYTVAFAAPPAEAPSEMSIEQDGKLHSVYVFGTALVLVFEDGSISISSMGPVGRVDIMMDGVAIKNVASVDIPAGQRTKMALDENSIIVKNVTAEDAEAVKKQIEDAYAAGASSIDLTTLTGVVAYKVNADGVIEDINGMAVPVSTVNMSVNSIYATAKAFEEAIQETITENGTREDATQPAPISNSSSSGSGGSSGGSSSDPTTAPTTAPTAAPTTAPTAAPTTAPTAEPTAAPTPETTD